MIIVKNERDKRKGKRIVDSLSCCGDRNLANA
jgi:hypothetical protein